MISAAGYAYRCRAPNIEALAKDDSAMRNDAELRAWLEGLGKIRKVVSDSICEALKP